MRDLGDHRSKNRRHLLTLLVRQTLEVAFASRHLTGDHLVEVFAQVDHDRRRTAGTLIAQVLLDVLGDDSFRVLYRLAAITQCLADSFTQVTDIDALHIGQTVHITRHRPRQT